MNLQEEILKIKNEMIDEFDKRVEALKEEEQEFPQDGDDYWSISETGEYIGDKWDSLDFEKDMLEIGNVFKTKQQAEFAAEKLKVEAELRKFSKPFEMLSTNWLIAEEKGGTIATHWSSHSKSQGTLYFESEEKARQAIETVGEDRIKKYIFGVED